MEDFERMQHREYQRQQLLEEFKRLVWEKIDDDGIIDERQNENAFWWGLIAGTTHYIHNLFQEGVTDVFYQSALDLFRFSIIKKIEAFTPIQAERHLMTVELLKFAIEGMSLHVHQEILRLSVPPARDEFLKQIGLNTLEE